MASSLLTPPHTQIKVTVNRHAEKTKRKYNKMLMVLVFGYEDDM